MQKYIDRQQAGLVLAQELKPYANRTDVIVLALPRGGVPVAYEIANTLLAPLDVFIVRKLGVPGHEELAMGAIASGDVKVFNDEIVQQLHVSNDMIQKVIDSETQELKRREKVYRGNRPPPNINNNIVILVDDGIATGATIRAAIQALKKLKPRELIVAVPVAEITTCQKIASLVDKLICPLQPEYFHAVGVWYEDFNQTSDEEVFTLLARANERKS